MRLTHLDGLMAFIAVAKHRSFTSAAGELELSSPALSQSVRQLEERLGVRLFNRTTRRVSLTEAGEEFFNRVAPAVSDLLSASEGLARYRDKPTGLLRLNAGRVVASTLLRPIVPAFQKDNPDVRVEVFIDDGLCDLVAEGFDAGFRLGESVERDMIALPFGPPTQAAVVGSPGYLRKRGIPQSLADLAAHDLVRFRFPSSRQLFKWEFVVDGKPVEYETHGSFICNDSLAQIDAALDGIGLAYTFDLAIAKHVKQGRLIRVLEPFCPRYPGFHIYYPGRRQVPLKLRRFIEFAREALEGSINARA
jgi:DNA-binding transcriptional LysR family regulator